MTEITPGAAPGPDPVVAEFPASTTQQRCWFLDRLTPGNPALNVAVRWELRGPFQAASLERAFQHVISRHEILRTRFAERDGLPVQQVMPEVPFKLNEVDIRATADANRMERIEAIAQEDAERPFDLGRAGLIRATLVRFAPERAILLIVAHQSCFDGFSIRVLGQEVGTALAAFEAGTAPDLPELPLQYGDFSLWQRDFLASGVLDEEAIYWEERLKDAPYFEVAPDKPRPALRSTDVAQLSRKLPDDFATRLEDTARRHGVSPFTYGVAVVSACLHRLTGAREVLFGTQIAGRNDTDLEPLIGVFINNIVLRMATDADAPMAAHVQQAKSVVEGALTHQNMPFNTLVERLNPVRDSARTPLISINFNLQKVFLEGKTYGQVELISVPSHAPGAVYDLDIAVMGRPSGWQLNIEYATDLFEESTIAGMLDLVSGAFGAAFPDPDLRLGDLPLDPALVARRAARAGDLTRIEEALMAHPFVTEAAAIRDTEGLYAFVTAPGAGTVPLETVPDRLMAHLDAALPEGARPRGVSVLAGFPRGAAGDLDRAVLRAPARAATRQATPHAPTDTALEEWLEAHWKEVLSVDDAPRDVSFFEQGGHSLLAVRLLTRINREFGLELGIATIYEHSTLPALAARIATARGGAENAPAGDDWRILPLMPEGTATPLIGVNTAATVLSVLGHMTRKRPATCVRLFDGTRGIDRSPRSFEDIAGEYARVVKQAHPDGPYLLFGNCVHGNLALETARVLHAAGDEIAAVVMKDVWEPAYAERLHADGGTRWRERLFALNNRLRQVRAGTLSLSAMLGSYRLVRATGVLQLAARLGLIDRVRLSDLEEEQERFVAYLTDARDRYRPAPVTFPVLHVVTAITPQGKGFAPSIGWEDVVTGPLKTVRIDEVLVHGDRHIGTAALAREIETFLTDQGAD